MAKVTGIGGVFIAAKDPAALRAWYKTHLGIDVQAWGGTAFRWADESGTPTGGTTAWSIGTGSNFAPGKAFMINYRVDDLDELLASLRQAGVEIVGEPQSDFNGKFAWIMDPDGNKVELWEPKASGDDEPSES